MDNRLHEFEKGHDAFQKIKFKKSEERFKKLVSEGQNPKALFIGCSDSRVMPALITGSKPGDLFIVRNIGNFVAPYNPEANYHATASAIEYAVSVLEVSDIIVCGHSHCGAIATLFKDIKETPENIHTVKWLKLGEEAKKISLLAYKNADKETMLRYTEKISVIYQIDNLLTYPGVIKRVEEGTLHLHGWHYDIENGAIEYYDDENYEFKPLSQK
ncbi:MAG: carbonic anhydrase [Epsilonproteobacteria bacterium (ex Lamellibrachia satsuma)]|nr:MAG: carbonic anhydrase [Epsilonproteobacteria bacterium (ex Lamellibrachia satsuma)]